MSSFTRPISITAQRKKLSVFQRFLPPISWPAQYEVAEPFSYSVGDLYRPESIVSIPRGFRFDGASIPLFARLILPRVHPQYLQAAALHDWLYHNAASAQRSRRWCDDVFCEAMAVLGMPRFWRGLMWVAVRLGGGRAWRRAARRQAECRSALP